MAYSRKNIGKNRNLRKRSRKGGGGGLFSFFNTPKTKKTTGNTTTSIARVRLVCDDELSKCRKSSMWKLDDIKLLAPPLKATAASNLIYVCCLIDSTVASAIANEIKKGDSIVYLNCNPYNTFGFGWRLNGWGDEGYFGGKELFKLFGPEGSGIITSNSEPKATWEFCKEIINLLKEQNIIVIDTADFDIKPILVDYNSKTGGEWYKNHLNLNYKETKEDLGYNKFINASTSFSDLDPKIIKEFEELAKYYKYNFIEFESKKFSKITSFKTRYEKHIEVLGEAVNKMSNDNIKACFKSVLEGNWAINNQVTYLGNKSSVEIMTDYSKKHAGSIMTMWQKWVSGVYYGPQSPPLLHDFVGLLFASLNGTTDEIIDTEPDKLNVQKLQNKILTHSNSNSENIMKILNNIKDVYTNLQNCKLFVDGESDDLLTIIAACRGLNDIIGLHIVFQNSVFHENKFTDKNIIPTTATNYKKNIGVDLPYPINGTKSNSISVINSMMNKYNAYVSDLKEYLTQIRSSITFETIECTGLLPKIDRYTKYINNSNSGLITLFIDTERNDISTKAFSNVMGNVQKVMLAINELGVSDEVVPIPNPKLNRNGVIKKKVTFNDNDNIRGGRRHISKKRRRPTNRKRHTKRRPTNRKRHTKRRR